MQPTETTIATVEVRHASCLRLLNGEVPFPEPFDDPRAPRRICEMVDQFINRSSFDLKAFCESLTPGRRMWSFTQELIIVVVSAFGVDEFLSKTVESLVAAAGREPVS